jgi:3-deoxy-manno-octulosonate cytidylyltransferase (CMP-KDO synthetase)
VEQHGNHTSKNVVAIVPARSASERLPGKMLLPIAGKPLLVHTLERVREAGRVDRVIAAVDSESLRSAISEHGFEATLTSPAHKSGSDRIAEIAQTLPGGSLIVNIQGDEPLINPGTVDRVIDALATDPNADMATVSEPITSLDDELLNPNVVKLVCDDDGYARYFSRSPIPFPRDAARPHSGEIRKAIGADQSLLKLYRKHVGVYGYRREYLLRYASLAQSELERIESLEQLRALSDRALIRVVESAGWSIGVDTREDYLRVKSIIESGIDIRSVREGEWDDVARVHVASWQGSFASVVPQEFLDSMSIEQRRKAFAERPDRTGYSMFVADRPNTGIVGFIDFGVPQSIPTAHAEIYSFYLHPDYQRRGIGERLFRMSLARMNANGVRSLCLEALERSPYRSFYDKMGGKVLGHSSHDVGEQKVPTVIYSWDEITTIL